MKFISWWSVVVPLKTHESIKFRKTIKFDKDRRESFARRSTNYQRYVESQRSTISDRDALSLTSARKARRYSEPTSSRKAVRSAINVVRSAENTETKDEIVSMRLSRSRRSSDSLKIAKYLVRAYPTIISTLSAYKSAYIRPRTVLILFLA